MASGKETGNSFSSVILRSPAVLTGLALLATTSAFAASSPVPPCDEVARDLQSLNVTVSDLSVTSDPAASRQDTALADAVDVESATQDSSAAPMLYLTPRVATLLDAVFDNTTRDPMAAEDAVEDVAAEPASETMESNSKSAPVTVNEKNPVVPQFQRHMYRNDI